LDFFDEKPFVVINGDILCNVPLRELYQIHLSSGALVSLLLHDCAPFNNVALDQHAFILGFGQEAHTLAQKRSGIKIMAFTGVHFIHPDVLKHLKPGKPESIIAVYQQLIREGNPPRALLVPGLFWREMGSLEVYWALNRELSQLPQDFLPPLSTGSAICVHPQARIASDVYFQGMVVVGKNSRIMGGAHLDNVIVWDHALVEQNSRLKNCIVTDGLIVEGMNDYDRY
jgi:NDP-sugar pyrophosphorylase family protein